MSDLLPEAAPPDLIECYGGEFPSDDPHSAEAYAKVLMTSFDFEVPTDRPFSASTEVFFLPDITLSWAKVSASRFTRTIRTIASRGADEILMVCYVGGHFEMTAGGATKRVEAGELAFIDMSQEITIESERVDNVSLAVSRRKLEALVPFIDGAHGFVRPQDTLSRLARGVMEKAVAVGPAMPVVDARGVSDTLLQLAAACLEPLSRQSLKAGRKLVSLVAIRAFIEQNLLDPGLGPQVLIDTFGITRSTLYRLFEPLGGVSAYVAQRKLHHAFRQLSDTRQPQNRISQVAESLGFSHPSAFTRAFKDAFGLAPREVQALAERSREREVQLLTSPEPLRYLRPISGTR